MAADNWLQKSQDLLRVIDTTIDVIKDEGKKKKAGEPTLVDDPRQVGNLFELIGSKMAEKYGEEYVDGLAERIKDRKGGNRRDEEEEDDDASES